MSRDDGVQARRVQMRGKRGRRPLLPAPRRSQEHSRRRRRVGLRPVPHPSRAASRRARACVARTAYTDAYVAF